MAADQGASSRETVVVSPPGSAPELTVSSDSRDSSSIATPPRSTLVVKALFFLREPSFGKEERKGNTGTPPEGVEPGP